MAQHGGACSICAQSKSSRQRPAGLLQSLPIPSQPWSHLSVEGYLHLKGLPLSWWSSSKQPISSPYPSCLQGSGPLISWLSMSFDYTDFQRTLSKIVGPSLSHGIGRPSVPCRWFSPRGSTLSRMGKLSMPTKSWRSSSAALSPLRPATGASSSSGRSMLITHCRTRPVYCRHLSVSSGLPCAFVSWVSFWDLVFVVFSSVLWSCGYCFSVMLILNRWFLVWFLLCTWVQPHHITIYSSSLLNLLNELQWWWSSIFLHPIVKSASIKSIMYITKLI